MSTQTMLYYEQTAAEYDRLHGEDLNPEHTTALERTWPLLKDMDVSSVMDVGCGTGRALSWYQRRIPGSRLTGVDPSASMLQIARERVPGAVFVSGTGESLPLPSGYADLVVATGILHHADDPARVIGEMFRVARKAVLISDHNNFSFGSTFMRWTRLRLHAWGLLGAACFVKQGFKKQGYTKEDGWWYPYSLLADYGTIARRAREAFVVPTRSVNSNDLSNLLMCQSHLAILAYK
jgi:ubiquinone/menaquinone biosynthesis C-methylase UbiE